MPRTPAQKRREGQTRSPKRSGALHLHQEGRCGSDHSPAYLAFRGMKVMAAMFRLKKEQAQRMAAEQAAMANEHPKE